MERDADRRWNDTERWKLEYSEKNLSHCQFVDNKSNMEHLKQLHYYSRFPVYEVKFCPLVF